MFNRTKRPIIALGLLVLVIAALWFGALSAKARSAANASSSLAAVISGVPGCLPATNEAPRAPQCVIGLKDDSGRYFELNDSANGNRQIARIKFGQHLSIYGLLTNAAAAGYQADGTLAIINLQ